MLQAATGQTAAETKKKSAELTMSKVVAGAGAAATTAVMGSFFGAFGTVFGAAVGSVVSTVAATAYQRSLERTSQTVRSRVRLPGGRTVIRTDSAVDSGQLTVPLQRSTDGGPLRPADPDRTYVAPAPEPTGNRRKRLLVTAGVTVGIFLLGLLVVTGIELVKGSPISGGTGTSVSKVIHPAANSAQDDDTTQDTTGSTDATSTPEPTADPTTEPSSTRSPLGGRANRDNNDNGDETSAPPTSGRDEAPGGNPLTSIVPGIGG